MPESVAEPSGAEAHQTDVAVAEGEETRRPELSESRLDEAIQLAKTALYEIAEFHDVGDFHEAMAVDDDIYSLRFVSNSPGFRDWWWTVSLTQIADAEVPTVLECGLLPGEGALLAPEWVPWAKRLARFRATHDSHGNPLPEPEDGEEASVPAEPRTRTRKRTRTRLRRRGDADSTANAAAEDGEQAVNEGRDADEGASSRNDSLPVAADIREYAEEMDEVLDGVTFEDNDEN